jgi:CPA1 family monovalent cation:H+ antiporter
MTELLLLLGVLVLVALNGAFVAAEFALVRARDSRLDQLEEEGAIRAETVERMRGMYRYRKRRFAARAGMLEDDGYEDRSLAYQRLLRELLDAQRRTLVTLRNQGVISTDVMRRIERDLDLEDSRLEI